MIKLFIKYSYIFSKQDKNLKIRYLIYDDCILNELFCGYLLNSNKTFSRIGDIFYFINFRFNKTYIWNEFKRENNELKFCTNNKFKLLFKECQKAYPRYIVQ